MPMKGPANLGLQAEQGSMSGQAGRHSPTAPGGHAMTDCGPGAKEAQGGARPSLDGEPVREQYPEEAFKGRRLALVYDTDSKNLNSKRPLYSGRFDS